MNKRVRPQVPLTGQALLRSIEATQSVRPYCVYDTGTGRTVPRWRYKTLRSALDRTLLHTKWMPTGTTLQVYDNITSTVYAEYRRLATSLTFREITPEE